MASLTPLTELRLLRGVRLTPSYNDTIYFADEDAQESYFKSKTYVTLSDYTFVRNNPNTVRVSASIQQCRTSNYIMFYNNGFYGPSYKWIYAFITDVNYVNNSTTEITFEIDIIQTYILHCSFGSCWIERNHTVNDDIGQHREPDFVPTSETFNIQTWRPSFDAWGVVVWSTMYPENGQWYESLWYTGKRYGGALYPKYFRVFSGVGVNLYVNTDERDDLLDYLREFDTAGHLDSIKTITLIPADIWTNDGHITYTGVVKPTAGSAVIRNGGTEEASSYTPINNKLYTYPYRCMMLSATSGHANTYKYEEMATTDLHVTCSVSPDTTATAWLGDFKNGGQYAECYNQYYNTSVASFPQVAVNTETFMNHLASNPYGLINSFLSIGAQTATGNAIGAISTTLSTAGTLHQVAMNSVQSLSNASGTTDFANGNIGFVLSDQSMTLEGLHEADAYFTRYGYAINRVRQPQFNNRPHFTYIKTRDAVVYGNNGYNANKQIADILDKGVTFWKNGDEIGNYNVNNKPT